MKRYIILMYLICHLLGIYSQNTDIHLLREINLNRNKNLDKTFITITNSHTIVPFTIMG
jgi:hypothetical protein